MSLQDMTEIVVSVESRDVYLFDDVNDYEEFRTAVLITYTDQYGDELEDMRLDEGPFDEGDMLMIGNTPVEIDDIYYDEGEGDWFVEYLLKQDSEWDDEETVIRMDVSSGYTWLLDNQIADYPTVYTNWTNDSAIGMILGKQVYLTDIDSDDDDAQLYIDIDEDGGGTEIDLVGDVATDVDTEFDNDVAWRAVKDSRNEGDWVVIDGVDDSGAEDRVFIQLDDDEMGNKNNITNTSWAQAMVEIEYTDVDTGSPKNCTLGNDCDNYQIGDKSGMLMGLSGQTVEIDGEDDVDEPTDIPDVLPYQYDEEESETIEMVTLVIPENEMRPTVFFGLEDDQNTSSVTITDAQVNTEVIIGGIDVMVEEFGVTGSVTGGEVIGGEPVTVQCDPVTVTCDAVEYTTTSMNPVGYKLVVVEGGQSKSNLVLIGGPSVNSMTKDLTTVDELCSAAAVKMVGNKLLVAGCEAADTASAANALMDWLRANV
jgi:hypothetical protein